MKKLLSICLALVCLLTLFGCKKDASKPQIPITYYYQATTAEYDSPDGMMTAEIREAYGHTGEYVYLVEQYLNGPKSYDCISPFPAGTTLENFELDSTKAAITLSSHITTLSGAELMFACVCLTKTVSEMTGVRSVQIGTVNGTINGSSTITLTPDSFVISNAQ